MWITRQNAARRHIALFEPDGSTCSVLGITPGNGDQTMSDDTHESNGRRELPTECASCGSTINSEEWHPTASIIGDTGVHRIRLFCDEQCKNKWTDR